MSAGLGGSKLHRPEDTESVADRTPVARLDARERVADSGASSGNGCFTGERFDRNPSSPFCFRVTSVGWYLILIVAGFLAGVVNTIAGGGSFLTLPALMFFGLDPKLANGTNRVAVLFSSGAAVVTFQKHGHLDRQLAMRLMWPTVAGVPVGGLLAVYLPAQAFEPVFGAIFLVMAVLLISNPKRLAAATTASERSQRWVRPIFFAIGIYVGFIQAGMGILVLLAMSVTCSVDLVASNAVKNWIAFLVTFAATAVFAFYGLIEWVPGLVMAVGNLLGGIVGARLAIKKGNRLIFWFLIIVMVATGLKLIASSVMQYVR